MNKASSWIIAHGLKTSVNKKLEIGNLKKKFKIFIKILNIEKSEVREKNQIGFLTKKI